MKQAVAGMIRIGELSDVTAAQVIESRREYRRASDAMKPAKRLLDVYTSQWFGNPPLTLGCGKKKAVHNRALELLRDGASEHWAQYPEETVLPAQCEDVVSMALRAATEKRFFHWELEFPEVFYGPRPGTTQVIERLEGAGFNAVIGNPPYVRVQELRQADPVLADFLALRYRSAVKNFDIYLPFFELGLFITKNQVSYITPNKWFATDYGAELRKLVVERSALSHLVDFRDFQLFPDATNYTCILTLSRKPRGSFVYVDASSGEILQDAARPLENLPKDGGVWTFTSGLEAALLQRLLGGDYSSLKELRDRAFQGLRTSDNDVYILRAIGAARKGLLSVISRATGQTHEIETALLKPLLSGEEIRAFSLTHNDQWILFPYDLAGRKPLLLSEKRLRGEYPGAWQYLKICEGRLRARERGKMDRPGWWAFGRNQNLDQFEQPKVMLPGYNDKPSAGIDIEGQFYHVSGYSLTLKDKSPIDLWAFVSLLNSSLLYWVLMKTGVALQRGFVEFRPQYLDKLPIVASDPQERRALKEVAQSAMRKGYDTIKAELNEIVYRLYGLTDDEVAIVEGRR
ncbi:MAG: Eco57I restriction-modification methylase domain-containing protein [Nitrospinae bacterium]|nr:Eco57I restriction-modification methylase domain-containing protein [Nitrospinota bacterium]